MVNLVANVIGALSAIVYVGFFAYKIDRLPLTIIVIVCLGLMVHAFYEDTRKDRAVARARRENGRSR
jgi:hypothetical protein